MRRDIVNFVFDNLEWLPRIGSADNATPVLRGQRIGERSVLVQTL
jgi:hypothetical protein